MPISRLGAGALAVATVAAVSPTAPAGAAAAEPAADHCVLTVVDEAPDGELITAPPECFATFDEAMDAAGLPYTTPAELPSEEALGLGRLGTPDASPMSSPTTLGIHFDGANRTGASITVTGTVCGGGHVNLSSAWVNRVSSTWNFCPTVGFWDGFDKTGDNYITGSTGYNLGFMSNRANSIGYAS